MSINTMPNHPAEYVNALANKLAFAWALAWANSLSVRDRSSI